MAPHRAGPTATSSGGLLGLKPHERLILIISAVIGFTLLYSYRLVDTNTTEDHHGAEVKVATPLPADEKKWADGTDEALPLPQPEEDGTHQQTDQGTRREEEEETKGDVVSRGPRGDHATVPTAGGNGDTSPTTAAAGGGDDDLLSEAVVRQTSAQVPSNVISNISSVDKNAPLEIVVEDDEVDGVDRDTMRNPANFYSEIKWQGKCWYKVKNFCVVGGQLTMYHDPSLHNTTRKGSLRMCNEFSQHSPTIKLRYVSEPLPAVLPGPVLTKTKGWILQMWCQDLFHMTLSLLPAFQTKAFLGPHPDVYIRIAKGVRKKKNQMCRVKLGDPRSFEMVKNAKWGGDRQFPFAGNPYWPFYKLLTSEPHRIFPLYGGSTKKTVCYRHGVIDKHYLKELDGFQAKKYAEAQLDSLNVTRGVPRKCGNYRLTFIDRRGKTRKVNNTDDIVATAKQFGFSAQAVALEHLPIREQLHLMTSTDVLLGVHGNGLTWLQFLPTGSVVIELVGIWYMPYSLLFGHSYLHSSMKKNPYYKQHGEYVPFPANTTELGDLLREAKTKLDEVSCGGGAGGGGEGQEEGGGAVSTTTKWRKAEPSKQKLDYLYKGCAPHC